jgi:hypothetical protein
MALHAASVVGVAMALAIAHESAFLVPGRYLLPALPAVIGLLVRGWQGLVPAGWQRRAWQGVALGLVAAGWLTPLGVLLPAYARPQPHTGTVAVPVGARFGEAIELVGYQAPAAVVPGQRAALTVCWRALAPVAANYPVRLDVEGADGQGYGRLVTYPGHGNHPTSFWMPGVTFCDDYLIATSEALAAPSLARVDVQVMATDETNGPRLPVAGSAEEAVWVPLPVKAAQPPAPLAERTEIRFGDSLLLRGFEVVPEAGTGRVIVRLEWEALAGLAADYSVFVHLRDTPQSAVAISQGQPRGGTYPTWLWARGEVVIDEHPLEVPAGSPPLALVVGVIEGGQRLPAADAGGAPLADSEAWLARDLALAP